MWLVIKLMTLGGIAEKRRKGTNQEFPARDVFSLISTGCLLLTGCWWNKSILTDTPS